MTIFLNILTRVHHKVICLIPIRIIWGHHVDVGRWFVHEIHLIMAFFIFKLISTKLRTIQVIAIIYHFHVKFLCIHFYSFFCINSFVKINKICFNYRTNFFNIKILCNLSNDYKFILKSINKFWKKE